ncbi:conidial yellow pigment biosynthesis polyketide synthase [Diplogelasinospora grovesii]|uniref:Conidial yellow pigment biosynthesis polyketide synthase n=1 Tax=Diplogelasinospora grovesii TaxID=303347 RepID=A0AAN6N6S9_9PEZI|nr:conidial yellow pigment biosynthesis polyketide synthase [Diplogelasinospora grovesii]
MAPLDLTNSTRFKTLTVVSQVLDFIETEKHSLSGFQASQGFCIGFLSAAALSSAKEWHEFKTNVCNAVRLAACIGVVVGASWAAQEAPLEPEDRAATISVRCKTAADRAYLETCLDAFPEAYISCITDDNTLTLTLPQKYQTAFFERAAEAKLAVSEIGIRGSYHHPSHAQAAATLNRICAENHSLLGLPNAEELRLPLRSTADAQLITAGALHEIAIELILCKRAHWSQAVKLSVSGISQDRVSFSVMGRKSGVIPLSLRRGIAAWNSGPDDHDQDPDHHEEIAVVGMACRFPRAENLTSFWELLTKGETAFGTLSPGRFDLAHIAREPRLAQFWGNFLDRPDVFDHRFFSLSGREAKSMDPHSVAATTPERIDVGCYLGVGAVDYEHNVASEAANAFAAVGTLRAFISGRISHFFGWEGPSITFDTACSSSAVAIHTACKAVLGGECSMALAGGVNVITSPTLHQNLAAASFLNPGGSSKAFDAAAGGYCRGEGAGMIVLKKLSRALTDGDEILGVIASSAVNQGSNCSSITVPDSGSQSALYKRVLSDARLEPKQVGYVEAHGTGTPVGDPIEYESVRLALTGSGRNGPVLLGAVKDNIGHTEAASGVAGVIKVLLMMQHSIVPKQANFVSLNPRIKACLEIVIPTETQPWAGQHQHVALVNNYGAAGSNAALLLRSRAGKIPSDSIDTSSISSRTVYPILLSAKTASHLHAYADALKLYLAKSQASFGSIAYNVARTRNVSFEHRIAFTASDARSAVSALTTLTETKAHKVKLPVVLCFGGQTGRTVKVSRGLYDSCGLFRQHLDQCDAVCQKLGLPSIYPAIFRGDVTEDLVTLHCMLLSLQISSAKCWIECGLEVGTLVGHSFGQLAALCVAGSISLEHCFQLVSGRARLIRDNWGLEDGAMLSVECDKPEVEALVDAGSKKSTGLRVDVACYNGPRSFVLAGDTLSIARAREECQKRSIKHVNLLNTHAYHSYLADGILQDLATVAGSVTIQPPVLRVETCSANGSWSSFTAKEVVQHTREPVYFGDAIDRISKRLPSAVWLEAGSASPIISMTKRIVNGDGRSDVFVAMELGNDEAVSNVAQAVCQLWQAGSATRFWLFHPASEPDRHYQNVNLPPYQFEKTSHWIQLKMSSSKTEISNEKTSLVSLVSKITPSELLFSVDTTHPVFVLAGSGHAVTGQSLCPASMYIELAAMAAQSVVKKTATKNETSSLLPHIEALAMSAPLGLGNGISLFLRLSQIAPDSWDFSLFSRPSGGSISLVEGEKTEHASGRITWTLTDATMAERRLKLLQRFGAQGVRRLSSATGTTGISGTMVYKLFSDVVTYADYYRGVRSVSALENEAVGFVTVPAQLASRFARHDATGTCDPIILDNFLQVAGIHVNCLSPRDKNHVFVCTAVEEVIFTSSFMTNKAETREWSVYSRRYELSESGRDMANDIFVCDAASGRLVLAILGATFKSVPFKSLARGLTRLNKVGVENSEQLRTTSNLSPSVEYHSSDDVQEDSGYQTLSSPLPVSDAELRFKKRTETPPVPNRLPPQSNQLPVKQSTTKDELERVRSLFSAILEVPIEEITPTSTLDELGVDSLLVSEIVSEVQNRFHVTISQSDFLGCNDVLAVSRLLRPDQPVAPETSGEQPQSFPAKDTEKITGSTASQSVNDGSGSQDGPNIAVLSRDAFVAVKPSYDAHAETTGFAGFYGDAFQLQSELVVGYVVEAFATLGCDLESMQAGDQVPAIPFDPKHKKLIPQLYKLLADGGLVEKEADGIFRRAQTSVPAVSASALHQRMLDKFPKHASETQLLHATGSKLADCLSGKADPIALIFQNAAARALLEDVYTNAPMFKTGTLLLGQYLPSVLERLGGRRELRILELGAGTGGTSKHVIETLTGMGQPFSYTFTDLSPSLVAAAKRKFAKWSSFMHYKTLDIEKEPAEQLSGKYDVILSTNCIHATRDLVVSTTNIRKMLRPDGILCLVELTRNLYWFDLVFGLLEGWWLFNDGREHALAHEQTWNRSLRAAGFEWVDWGTSSSRESELLRVITASPCKLETSADGSDTMASKETVVFKEVDGLQLQADIYYPPNLVKGGEKLPVALMIHGGGHIMLSRNDIRPEQTDMLLRNGFLPISIDYRLCPETTLLEGPMADVADALAWARTVLPRSPLARRDIVVDAERVVAVGWSSGGHLAMSLAWTSVARGIEPPNAILALYCATDYEDPFWTRPNVPAGAEVDGADSYDLDDELWAARIMDRPITGYNVPRGKRALGGWLAPSDPRSRLALHMNVHGRTLHVLLGGLDKRTRAAKKKVGDPASPDDTVRAASPLAQINAGNYTVPTFMVHPRLDDLIPWQQSERTWKALREQGVDAELRVVGEGAPHLFDLHPRGKGYETGMRAVREGYSFLAKHVGMEWR